MFLKEINCFKRFSDPNNFAYIHLVVNSYYGGGDTENRKNVRLRRILVVVGQYGGYAQKELI